MTDNENYFLKEMIRTYYQPEIEKLKEEITNLQQRIDKVIELIEPFIDWGECTINGKILKQIEDILKGESDER